MEAAVLVLALLFAANIGGSGAAATMGQVYGAGVIRRRAVALAVVAVAALAGAALFGGEVSETLSDGLVPEESYTLRMALIVLLAATIPLAAANLIGIPLSTSEVAVGAVVGIGAALGAFNAGLTAFIIGTWVALPLLAFILGWAGTRLLHRLFGRDWDPKQAAPAVANVLKVLLLGGGLLTAFAAGANNVGNAVAPAVASGALTESSSLLIGGAVIAGGAMLLGRRVLKTNGKRITELNLATGSVVTFSTGSLVLGASMVGVPVPLTQATSGAIMGVGFANEGRRALSKQVVRDMGTVWVASPTLSFILAFFAATWTLDAPLWDRPAFYGAMGALAAVAVLFIRFNRPRVRQSLRIVRFWVLQFRRVTLL